MHAMFIEAKRELQSNCNTVTS